MQHLHGALQTYTNQTTTVSSWRLLSACFVLLGLFPPHFNKDAHNNLQQQWRGLAKYQNTNQTGHTGHLRVFLFNKNSYWIRNQPALSTHLQIFTGISNSAHSSSEALLSPHHHSNSTGTWTTYQVWFPYIIRSEDTACFSLLQLPVSLLW